MDFTITIPHSLGVKGAADRLQALSNQTLRSVETESEGESDGYNLRTTTTITAGEVRVHVRGEATSFVAKLTPESIAQKVAEKRIRKALEG